MTQNPQKESWFSKVKHFYNENPFLQKVLFKKTWDKIVVLSTRNYFYDLFLVRNLILKLFFICTLAILVLGLGFGLREHFLSVIPTASDPRPVVINFGIAMSTLASTGKNDPSVVYFVQAIPIIIAFLCLVLMPKWYIAIGFTMMFFGGLTNIIDRAIPKDVMVYWTSLSNWDLPSGIPHTYLGHNIYVIHYSHGVADYFKGINSIFNIADVFIIMGVVLGILAIIVWIFFVIETDKKSKHNEPNHNQPTLDGANEQNDLKNNPSHLPEQTLYQNYETN